MTNLAFSQQLAQQYYDSAEQFPIDFNDAWAWLEYSTKGNGKKAFDKCGFIEEVDYTFIHLDKCVKGNNGGGSTRTNVIHLTCECLKQWGMMAGTPKGKEIRMYFLECERIAKAAIAQSPQLPLSSARIKLIKVTDE